jgi:hypothetical protein
MTIDFAGSGAKMCYLLWGNLDAAVFADNNESI